MWSNEDASRILFPFIGTAQNLDKFKIISDWTLKDSKFMEYVMNLENSAKIIKVLYLSKLVFKEIKENYQLLLVFIQ